jgi:hypothetical protein
MPIIPVQMVINHGVEMCLNRSAHVFTCIDLLKKKIEQAVLMLDGVFFFTSSVRQDGFYSHL